MNLDVKILEESNNGWFWDSDFSGSLEDNILIDQ